ncbi:MAG TPA: heparan-alpha-glucosaminide N-acetyltransferase domain-containing protein [Terriglobales bacterium]|nr:heparan-alpha-glucosaminide N-acetyltransferase domain-containing protein [Terriglobales bacterium]
MKTETVPERPKVVTGSANGSVHGAPPNPARLMSLDVFRGMTIAGMTLVNNPGTWAAIYPPLAHAEWHGWTHTDLVFPFFLFIAGVSMAYSFSSRTKRGAKKSDLRKHTLRRAVIIFLIGFLLAITPYFNLDHVRIMGVLQRIAVCYAVAGIVYLYLNAKQRAAVVAVALAGYWAAMTFIPVPGHGAGNLTPDGNLSAYIDRALMSGHLWKPTWDPEGLLSTVPAIATTLIGTFVGDWLLVKTSWQNKVKVLAIGGAVAMIVGLLLHPLFPINKPLWTSSYVVFTAGYAMVVLAACYWMIDVKQWRAWSKPFLVFGMNAILIFTASGWLSKNMGIFRVQLPNGRMGGVNTWIYQTIFAPLASDPRNASLAYGLTYVLCWLAIAWWLYNKKIFVKV